MRIPTICCSIGFVLFQCAFCPVFATAQELSAAEQQKLAAVQSSLKHIETNLNLALRSAGSGSGALTGSKSRLTQVRLNSAVAAVPDTQKKLAELPANEATVKQSLNKLDELNAAIAALEIRLGKKPTPKATSKATDSTAANASPSQPKQTMTGPAKTVKMNYQQVDTLKGANFNLREVEGNCQTLDKLLAELELIEDKLSIDYRKVRRGMATLENATRKAGFTKTSIESLPADGEGVDQTSQRLAKANATLARSLTLLNPLNEKLNALIDPKNYPNLQSDLQRLSQLGSMYRDPTIFLKDRTRAASVVKELDAAQVEAKRIENVYTRLIQQKTDEGNRIAGASKSFAHNVSLFLKAANTERANLPKQIESEMKKIDQMASNAVESRKPLFFTGGIPQAMGLVTEKIELLQVLDSQQALTLKAAFSKFKKELAAREKSLATSIINQNRLPADNYRNDDRKQVVDVAIDAWKYQEKDFDVLAERIPAATWARETKWEYNNGTWYFIDRSKLQVQLIVADKKNKLQAIIRPVTVIKNHQKGDTMIGTPMYSGDDPLQPSAYLLRSNIK